MELGDDLSGLISRIQELRNIQGISSKISKWVHTTDLPCKTRDTDYCIRNLMLYVSLKLQKNCQAV